MCLGLIRNLFSGYDTWEDRTYQLAVDWNRLKYNYLPRSYYKKACDFAWFYYNNREKRNAILQRIRQLKQNSDVYQYNLFRNQSTSTKHKSRSPNQMSRDTGPKDTSYTEDDRRRELQELDVELRRIQLELFNKWHDAPDNAAARICKLGYEHTDEEGRSDVWYNEREACSASGGCCGRTCGCCEKPLHEYYVDTGRIFVDDGEPDSTEGKELVRLYGHCTAECACCVITHGVYKPRLDLPKPKFAR